jgi:hypothetical protein
MRVAYTSLRLLIAGCLVLGEAGATAGAEPSTVCLARKATGLGGATITLTLSAQPSGDFVQLAGQATFSQAIAPPGGLVVYAVAGAAIPNTDGWWVSLEGAGYDLAGTVFRGTFALQVGDDPEKSTISYTKQSLDGSSSSTLTGAVEVIPCQVNLHQ